MNTITKAITTKERQPDTSAGLDRLASRAVLRASSPQDAAGDATVLADALKTIASLREELAARPTLTAEVERVVEKTVEVPTFREGEIAAIQSIVEEAQKVASQMAGMASELSGRLERIGRGAGAVVPDALISPVSDYQTLSRANLPEASLAFLDTLAAVHAAGLAWIKEKNLALLVLKNPYASMPDSRLSRLIALDLVRAQMAAGREYTITPTGTALAIAGSKVLTLSLLHKNWMGVLPAAQQKVLSVLTEARRQGKISMKRAVAVSAAGYSPTSNSVGDKAVRALAVAGLVRFPSAGMVEGTDLLFPKGLN